MRPLCIANSALHGVRLLQRRAGLPRRARHVVPALAKMDVSGPSESFGGRSPERKAAEIMSTFFTFVAVRIILGQLEGSGRRPPPTTGMYKELVDFLQENPITNGDAWLAKLMQQNEMIGVRIMEVREAYASQDFEWDQLQVLGTKVIQEGNVRLLRQYAKERFTASLAAAPDGDDSTASDMPSSEG